MIQSFDDQVQRLFWVFILLGVYFQCFEKIELKQNMFIILMSTTLHAILFFINANCDGSKRGLSHEMSTGS